MNTDLFKDVVVDPTKRPKFLDRPEPRCEYIIHFTPRSGSSWLTDILAATRKLGHANEIFNPTFVPRIAEAVGATDMDEYAQRIKRRFNTQGVFGFEVTAHQLKAVFENYAAFQAYFPTAAHFWLIREDIVIQAVSLAKMVSTKVAHTKGAADASVAHADAQFAYDGPLIRKWLDHIRAAEVQSERWFDENGISPLRMSYETIIPLGAHGMVGVIAGHLGVPTPDLANVPVGHEKLGTSKNTQFADRFREENAGFIQMLTAERAEMLSRLHPIAEMTNSRI